MQIIKVAIVEDDQDIRELTAGLLNFYNDIECVGVFGSAEDFMISIPNIIANVVLMDIGLPGMNGIECIKSSSKLFPNIEFLIYSDHLDTQDVFQALTVGANGYVLKGSSPEKLVDAIRDIHAGGSPMSRQISRMVAASFQKNETLHPDFENLTTQEWEVLKGLDKGYAYKEIASIRFVSEHTVRSQVRSIYEKLHVHSRTDALNKYHKKH
ncbi:MAG: response regulator transcription factor [Saprospiraceae bacterium]|nr:response regulator transcription factor [Candidatus Defluviibacterium haderslevense]MBK7246019.1 response regulator transcription factor [Candidatus Defluviibacterium haderslevense]